RVPELLKFRACSAGWWRLARSWGRGGITQGRKIAGDGGNPPTLVPDNTQHPLTVRHTDGEARGEEPAGMKRSRAKAVGLGLALLAGELRAADGDWRPEGGPTAAAAPSLLPREMQPDQWVPAGAGDPGTVWLPARRSVAPAGGPSVVPVAVTPNPNAVDPVAYPRPATVGPLVASAPLAGGMLPESPTVPAPAPIRPDPPDSPKDWRPVAPVSRPATEPVFAQPTAPQP